MCKVLLYYRVYKVLLYVLAYIELRTISRLLTITGLFGRIPSVLQGSFAEETYDFKEPTNRSHPLACLELRVAVQRHIKAMKIQWLIVVRPVENV